MPATKDDIEHLKGLVRWARTTGAKKHHADNVMAEALEKAIGYLEEPDRRRNIVGYVLAALHRSMRHVKDGNSDMWIVVDRELHTWAMGQIESMFPHKPGTDPVGDHPPTNGKRKRS